MHQLDPSKQTCHVAFVTRNYSSNHGMSNIGLGVTNNSMAKILRRDGYHAESWSTHDAAELLTAIDASLKASARDKLLPLSDVVITSPSWMSIKDIGGLCWQYPNIRFTLVNHTGTAYLQIDGNSQESGMGSNKLGTGLELERHNFRLAANNSRFVKMIQQMLKAPCQYLPNLYDTQSYVTRVVHAPPPDTIRIGGFGAPRPWKNQFTAAQAAVMIARELGKNLEFYYNQGNEKDDRLYRGRADLFAGERDLKLCEISWENWPIFRRTIGTMDLLVQPSFDETFNVVTADGIAGGVASVVTDAIEWAPENWKAVACDPGDCCRVGIALLHDPHAVTDGRDKLTGYVNAALNIWRDYLGR